MAANTPTGQDASVTSIVTGIINDAQDLFAKQVDLLRHDVEKDIRHAKEAAAHLATGAVVTFIGVLVLCGMLVYLLSWLFPELPLWACYAIVGGPITLAGLALLYRGWDRAETLNPLPEESLQAVKENVQWTTRPRAYGSK
jgi:hypothetical protein